MTDDRALRDALEVAQARAMELEDRLDAAEDELVTVRAELEEMAKPMPAPGESREVVRLRAQVHAMQLQLGNVQAERDGLVKQLALLTIKPEARERLEQLAELTRLRNRVAALEREKGE